MESNDNQQKGPNTTDKESSAAKSGQEIIAGAKQTDQLDKLNQDKPEGGREAHPEKQAGTPPGPYDPKDR
jgi:hypothetical protein